MQGNTDDLGGDFTSLGIDAVSFGAGKAFGDGAEFAAGAAGTAYGTYDQLTSPNDGY